jgi:DNA-binding NarL/FixJ family response regulator
MRNEINIFVTSTDDEECKHILTILSEQDDFHIAGVEKDESGTIIKSERLKPDVLILDLQPPGLGGEELAPIIHRRSPQTAIVMLCDKDEENYAGLALKSGIAGFLLKEKDTDKLVPVIKIVFYGGYYVSAPIFIRVLNTVTFINGFQGRMMEQKTGSLIFSPAERGIITGIAQGFSDQEIAKHLNFSAGTVSNFVTAIKRKTKLKNRVQIAVYSLVYGLVNFDQLRFLKLIDKFPIMQYNKKKSGGTEEHANYMRNRSWDTELQAGGL